MSIRRIAELGSVIRRLSFLVLLSPFSLYFAPKCPCFQITYVLKDSNCHTLLPKILMLAILATCASSSSTKVSKCPHVCPYFPIDFRFGLLKIKKVFLARVMGLSAKIF
ncbi:hypothetical protein H5410_042145 [Solanum commersonii]|uniref:Uncharacterized protein n=1 Tax=Solanum commersonii TaxID=4109 RepID=A0A9J5XVJ9_SOLCO|nr:hypothetical protein H5410_042145 [Solanum commersonii]